MSAGSSDGSERKPSKLEAAGSSPARRATFEKEDNRALYDEIQNMSETNRLDLDPICNALKKYMEKHPPSHPGFCLPNRICALAAVRIAEAWESAMWNQEPKK